MTMQPKGFDIGEKVMVTEELRKERYEEFSEKVLIIRDIYEEEADLSDIGQKLYSLETEDGEKIGPSLYDCELERTV